MQICAGVHQVGGEGFSSPGDAAVYLVVSGAVAALIDAGCGPGTRRIIDNVRGCLAPGDDLAYLFLTHCHFDHAGGAPALRRELGCHVVAHALDARFLESGDPRVTAAAWYGAAPEPFCVDEKITGARQVFPVGDTLIEALHCPGHSPGSVVYLVETGGRRVLFGQDVHGPLHPDLLSDRDEYLTSLSAMQNLRADILCEGHFGVIRGRERVRAFIQQFLDT